MINSESESEVLETLSEFSVSGSRRPWIRAFSTAVFDDGDAMARVQNFSSGNR